MNCYGPTSIQTDKKRPLPRAFHAALQFLAPCLPFLFEWALLSVFIWNQFVSPARVNTKVRAALQLTALLAESARCCCWCKQSWETLLPSALRCDPLLRQRTICTVEQLTGSSRHFPLYQTGVKMLSEEVIPGFKPGLYCCANMLCCLCNTYTPNNRNN